MGQILRHAHPHLCVFFDALGHAKAIGLPVLAAHLLSEPDGSVNNSATLQLMLGANAEAKTDRIEALGALIGFGCNDSSFAKLRHTGTAGSRCGVQSGLSA